MNVTSDVSLHVYTSTARCFCYTRVQLHVYMAPLPTNLHTISEPQFTLWYIAIYGMLTHDVHGCAHYSRRFPVQDFHVFNYSG